MVMASARSRLFSVVDASVVYASGTNYPYPFFGNPPPAMMKTGDGGTTWSAWSMTAHASLLVDVLTRLDPKIPDPEPGLEGLVVE